MRPGGAPPWRRVVFTLLLAWAAAALLRSGLHSPIPWMIGPLLATSAAKLPGAPSASWIALRNAGQWVTGIALGLYFTPAVDLLLAGLWWARALGLGFGAWLRRRHAELLGLNPAQRYSTAYFAGAIGGASEMTLIAERHGARTDLVAAAHGLRVLLVSLNIPLPCRPGA